MFHTSQFNLFCDGFFVLNERLMFGSLYGRDSSFMQFMGVLSNDGEIRKMGRLDLINDNHKIGIRIFSELEKRITKLSTNNYGLVTNGLLIARELLEIDYERQSAWLIFKDGEKYKDVLWSCIKNLSTIPLLDKWSNLILQTLQSNGNVTFYESNYESNGNGRSFAIFGLKAIYVTIPSEFDEMISKLIKANKLLV